MSDRHANPSIAISGAARGGRAGIMAAYATAFFSSMCILIIELVAGRVIAQYLGQSLYTWTSIIGIVLAGIAIGNYIGGRIADRYRPTKALAVLLFLACLASLTVPDVNSLAGQSELLIQLDWPPRIAFHILITFLLPSAVLGTIGPVAAKFALDQGRATGRTVGNIYAWGALGSIIGTFLTGFYLLAWMRVSSIIYTVAGGLLLISLLYGLGAWLLSGKGDAPTSGDAGRS